MVRPKTILSRSELEAASEFAARAGLSLEQWLYALASVPDRNGAPSSAPEAPRETPRHGGDPFARPRFFSEQPRHPDPRFAEPRHPDARHPDPRYPDPRYPDLRATEASVVSETRGLLEASEQRTAEALAKLLGWVETSSSRTEGEIGRIADTCGKISDSVRSSLDVINQRLSTVEHTVKAGNGGAIPDLLQRIENRIAQLEHTRRPGVDPAELSEAFSEFEQRLDGIARYMEASQRTSTGQSERLNVIETALALALKRMEATADQAADAARLRSQQAPSQAAKHAAWDSREAERSLELQEVHAAIQQLQGSINVAVPKINAAAESVLSSVASAIPQEIYAVSHRLDSVDRQLGALGNKVDPLAGLNAEIPGIRAELARIAAAMQPDLQAKLEALEESVNTIIDSFRRVDDSYRESRTANDSIVELIGRIGEIQSSVDDITARLPGNIGTLLELAKKGTSQANVVESLDRLHERMSGLSADHSAPREVLRRLDSLENAIRTTGFDSLVEDATSKVAANLNDQIADTIKSVFDTFERNTKCDTILNTINSRLTEVLQSPDLAKSQPQTAAAAVHATMRSAAAPQPAPAQPAPPPVTVSREDEASRLARALKAAERARDEVPPEPRAPAAPQPDDYAARLAQVTGGAYRPQPAMRAAAASADISVRRSAPQPEVAPATQVLRDPPAPEGLRLQNQVPPAPPPATEVEREPAKRGRRGKLPIAAASIVALMAGLGWAAAAKYGDSPQLAAMLDRLKSMDHVDEVLALFQAKEPRSGREHVAAIPAPMPDIPPPATLDPVSPMAQPAAFPSAEPSGGSRASDRKDAKAHVVIDTPPPVPVSVPLPPVRVSTKAEPERAPFPPVVEVSQNRGDIENAKPAAVKADVEAAATSAPDADGLERSREEKASVTGSIGTADGVSAGAASPVVQKCPDYETAVISTGVTRCAPERQAVTPERRSEIAPKAAPEKRRLASITPAPAALPAGNPLVHKPTLTAVEKAFFSKPLQEALVADDPVAAYDAGMRLLLGKGVPRDSKAATRWLQAAAEEGLAPAQYELGSIYELGTGIPKDIPLAMEWYEKAARGGNVKAMHNLGALLSDSSVGTPDMAGAAHWFRKAAEYGVRESQYNMGFLCVRGVGVPQDLTEAYLWFSLAAAQGDTNALKKKQMVTGLLDEESLSKAKSKVDMFQGSIPDLSANAVDVTGRPWSGKKKVVGS
jgi:TPR repeat protein